MTKPMIMIKKVCIECSEEFQTNNDSYMCYRCTLADIIAEGFPPEEGDFNTARIRSGTLTEKDRADLQRDLESVETGRSRFEPDDEDVDIWAHLR